GEPSELLEMKIDEIERGDFVGIIKEDREVRALALNFDLSGDVVAKLDHVVARRAGRKGEDLVRLEAILEYARAPNETADVLARSLLSEEVESLPDLAEAEDVMKKFGLDKDARCTLVEIVLARADDSSRVLGRLEVYLEDARQPGASLAAIAGKLKAGGDVPEDPPQEFRRERARSRSRSGARSRSRSGSRQRGAKQRQRGAKQR
ncbi:unnamed protein product, partial [Prorocentrum cordatum]